MSENEIEFSQVLCHL